MSETRTATLTVHSNGFHGPLDIALAGTNWRAWNAEHIAVDMTPTQTKAMLGAAAFCARRGFGHCECGGYPIPELAASSPDPTCDTATWLVPIAWVGDDAPEVILAAVRDSERR